MAEVENKPQNREELSQPTLRQVAPIVACVTAVAVGVATLITWMSVAYLQADRINMALPIIIGSGSALMTCVPLVQFLWNKRHWK